MPRTRLDKILSVIDLRLAAEEALAEDLRHASTTFPARTVRAESVR